MSHAALSQEARDERGISNSLLRLSVGLENVDDLISDFENALFLCRRTCKCIESREDMKLNYHIFFLR